MPDPTLPPASRRPISRVARVLVPVGAVAVAFGGFAIAYAATDSGTDTPHDVAERGLEPVSPSADDDTPSATGPAATDVPDGATQMFPAAAAGTVTIGRSGATLTVVAVGTNPGWSAEIEQGSGPEVEVEFRNGTARVDVEAEFEDGAVRVRVRERTEADDEDDDVTPPTSPTTPATRVDNSGPGSVNSGRDDEDENEHEDEHESGSSNSGDDHSGSESSGSSSSGSGSSGSGHSGSGTSGSGD